MDADACGAEVEVQREYLMRVAVLQLPNRDAAKDVVQHTLLAALAAAGLHRALETLRPHLAACKACTAFDRQMALLHEAMKRYRK